MCTWFSSFVKDELIRSSVCPETTSEWNKGPSSGGAPSCARSSSPVSAKDSLLVPSERSSFHMQSSRAEEKGIERLGPLQGIITCNNKTYPPQRKQSIQIGLMEDSGFQSGFWWNVTICQNMISQTWKRKLQKYFDLLHLGLSKYLMFKTLQIIDSKWCLFPTTSVWFILGIYKHSTKPTSCGIW